MNRIIKDIFFYLTVLILIFFIGNFSYKIYAERKDNYQNSAIRDDISKNIVLVEDKEYYIGGYDESKFPTDEIIEEANDTPKYNPVNEETAKFISANFKELKDKNPETVAWLYVPGTAINYSVVQTIDNSYYLKHNFENEENRAGWIFGDYRSDFTHLGRNTVIYGHNQLNESMFGDLKKLIKTEDWFKNEEHKYIYLATPEASYVFEVVSVYVTGDNQYIKHNLSNDEEYQKFIDTIIKSNTIDGLSKDLDITDKILTLSTCHSGQRLSVQSKLIKTKLY